MGSMDQLGRPKKKNKKKCSHMTMMVVPHSQGTAVKNYCIPMWVFKTFMAVSVSCILIVGYFISGFFYLKYLAVENQELKQVNATQAREIDELKGLAGTMRSKLEYLVQLDEEVRAKVGLTKAVNSDKQGRGAEGSRAGERYQFMTAELLQVKGDDGYARAMVPYIEQERLQVAPGIGGGDNEGTGSSGDMPVIEGEINTLEDLKEQLEKMDLMLTMQADTMNKLKTDVERQIAYQKAIPNAWPLQGRITSGFGWRKNPYSSRLKEYHQGIDIAAAYGSAIKAAGDGIVTFAGYKSSWGRLVVISHGYGFVTQYAHNSSLLVKEGDKVKRGQIIARLGNTGRSTGPHLHFGIAKDGSWINPLTLLNR